MTPTPRTRVRRQPGRGVYDRGVIDAILDEACVCHLAFVDGDGQPYAVPTLHARVGDRVYFHGSAAGRTLKALAGGAPVCLTATLIDGLVLARSAFHHSVNYRSVMVLGTATLVTEPEEKERVMEAFTEHLIPGRWADIRWPSAQELKGTSVLWIPLDEASAKVRAEPPKDEEADYASDAWAGVIPLALSSLEPEDDPKLRPGIPRPPYVEGYAK